MANTRISDLTASASNLASTDLAPVVQTAGVGPVKMTGLQLAGGLLGSTTFNGSTVTTSSPVLNLTQTWNAGAVTFTGLKFNVTNTASAAGSKVLDLQINGVSYWAFQNKDAGGNTTPGLFFGDATQGRALLRTVSAGLLFSRSDGANDYFTMRTTNAPGSLAGIGFAPGAYLGWDSGSGGAGTLDLMLTRGGVATLQLGAADAAAPVAQFFKVQGVVAGTSNTAGANFTIQGSQGTGTGAGGSIIFQVAPAGSTGTAQNAYSTALTIDSSKNATFTGNGSFIGAITLTPASNSMRLTGFSGSAYIDSGDSIFHLRNYTTFTECALAIDAANTLALRNGTNAQLFRVYSTYNGTNDAYGAIGAAVNLDGTSGDANTLYIGSQKKGSPTALTKLAIQVDGTTRADYGITYPGGFAFTSAPGGAFTVRGGVGVNANFGLLIEAGSGAQDYSLFVTKSGGTTPYFKIVGDSGLVCFGTNTSVYPALKRVSANLQVIAGDGSSSAGFIVGNQALATTATDGFLYIPTCAGTPTGVPTTQTGTAPLVVDSTNNKLYVYVGGAWTAMN